MRKKKTPTKSKPTAARQTTAASRAKAQGKAKAKAASRPARPELEKYRARLLEEKARLEAELQDIETRTSRAAEPDSPSEPSGSDDHPADLASETFEREKDLAIGESVETMLSRVRTALVKIDRGTYGTCDLCGRPIPRRRLEALPFATLCIDCQGRLETQ
jgi:RNA polymerase-binding protein DksA